MRNVKLRYQKHLDFNNRVKVPKPIVEMLNLKEFYLELNDDDTITLVPIKKEKGE